MPPYAKSVAMRSDNPKANGISLSGMTNPYKNLPRSNLHVPPHPKARKP